MNLYNFVVALLFIVNTFQLSAQKTVITIGNTSKTVENTDACKPKNWNNSAKNGCACCIAAEKHTSNKNAENIIQDCKQKKLCTDTSLQEIAKDQNSQNNNDLVNKIYSESIVIKHVDFDPALLTSSGGFTETSLVQFLVKAYQENKLPHADFNNPNCLMAKDLAKTAGATGINLLQLFKVQNTCTGNTYIIKQMGIGSAETANIERIEHVPGMNQLIAPNTRPGYPGIAFPLAYLEYGSKSNKVRLGPLSIPTPIKRNVSNYLAIMPAAGGRPLGDFILQFNADQSAQNELLIKQAYETIGQQLALFYALFMEPGTPGTLRPSIIHGDLHSFNIFYDSEKRQVTFIDIETMAASITKRRDLNIDFTKLLYVPIAGIVKTEKGLGYGMVHNVDKKKWIDISIGQFVRGYVSTYPDNLKRAIFQSLYNILKNASNKTISVGLAGIFINPIEVHSLIKNYVKPLFETLARQWGFTDFKAD